MTLTRRHLLQRGVAAVGLFSVACLTSSASGFAETNYPDKPIRLIVGFAAGGPADTVARLLSDELSRSLGKPIIIENAAGAGGNIATDRVVRSAPDGHTLLLAASGMIVVNPSLYQNLTFDTVKDLAPISQVCVQPNILIENAAGAGGNIATDRVVRSAPDGHTLLLAASGMIVVNPSLYQNLTFDTVKDLAPISQVCVQPNILVIGTDVHARSVQELVALTRSAPDKFTFASGGVGTTQHLAGELFKSAAQLDIRHVAYRSIAQAVPDLLTGRVTMAFAGSTVALPQVREGKLRALAVTSLQRSSAAPDVPTMAESGFPGFHATAWFGLMAPAGTPASIVERVHHHAVKVLALPGLRRAFDELGMHPIGNSPEAFASAIKAELPYWARVIGDSRMRLPE